MDLTLFDELRAYESYLGNCKLTGYFNGRTGKVFKNNIEFISFNTMKEFFGKISIKDKNDKILKVGDIIDIGQTVNGYSRFFIYSLYPLDIRYAYNIDRVYEYEIYDLIRPNKLIYEIEFEII